MTEQQYIDYFELLATKHARIAHTPEQPHFIYAKDDNFSELEEAVRSKVKFPVLVADQFLDSPSMRNDNFRTQISGGFSVLVKMEKGSMTAIRQARSEARAIAQSILFKLRRDFMQGGPMWHTRGYLELEFEGAPTPVVAGIATGWSYPIQLTVPLVVAVALSDWLP